jgi:hypothetical protein
MTTMTMLIETSRRGFTRFFANLRRSRSAYRWYEVEVACF